MTDECHIVGGPFFSNLDGYLFNLQSFQAPIHNNLRWNLIVKLEIINK